MNLNKRKTLQLKVKLPNVESLQKLANKLSGHFQTSLEGKYGKVLDLMSITVYPEAVTALAQFYDPKFRCFFFQDFQLTPTLEEFERIFGMPLKGKMPYTSLGFVPKLETFAPALHIEFTDIKANWKKKGVFFGFWRTYLEKETNRLEEARDWVTFRDVLALLIYGLVLFPTYENFIDSSAISVFWAMFKDEANLVPTLLADVLFSLYVRHQQKGGTLAFCFPLLYKWMTSHMFKVNAYIGDLGSNEWAKTLVSQTERSIIWYARKLDVGEIIFNCGNFSNVPLIGSKGCISYNPTLALRQLGHPMLDIPSDQELEEMILMDMGEKDPSLLQRIVRAWHKVHVRRDDLGKKDATARESYTTWVKERVKEIKLPFIIETPAPPPAPAPISISYEEAEDLKATIARLAKEKEEMQSKLDETIGENMRLKRKIKEEEESLEESNKKASMEEDSKEQFQEGLMGAHCSITNLQKQLKETQVQRGDAYHWRDLAIQQKGEERRKFEAKIQDLKDRLKDVVERLAEESRCKEEALSACSVNPEILRQRSEDLSRAREQVGHWRTRYEQLREQCDALLDQIGHLDQKIHKHEDTIEMLECESKGRHEKFCDLVEFCNQMIVDIPWKLELAVGDMKEDYTPPAVYHFVYLCKDMVTRFKAEMKALRPHRGKPT